MADDDWQPPRSVVAARRRIREIAGSIEFQTEILQDQQRSASEAERARQAVLQLTTEQSQLLRWLHEHAARNRTECSD
jgi:hypothetical protein